MKQIYDIPKNFGIEEGADYRVFLLDNHRPLHLKNVYSRHTIVVFDDTIEPTDFDADNQYDDIPSEASNVESMSESNSDNNLDSDEETVDEEFVEEDEEDDEFGGRYGEDEEFDADGGEGEIEGEEAEEAGEGEEGDDEAEEGDDLDQRGVEADANDVTMDLNDRNPDVIDASDDEDHIHVRKRNDKHRPARKSVSGLHDMDTTMIAGYEDGEEDGVEEEGHRLMDQSGLTENLLEGEEDGNNGEFNRRRTHGDAMDDEEDEEDFRLIKRSRRSDLKQAIDQRKQKRQNILQYYRKSVTYSWPTAIVLLPFVRKQFSSHGHVPLDVMWQAILGLTDQYQRGHITEAEYEGLCHSLKIELGEHLVSAADRVRYTAVDYDVMENAASAQQPSTNTVNTNNGEAVPTVPSVSAIQVGGAQTGNIEETAEYRFFLHRHWSLFEAMTHSSYIASKFSIWSSTGQERLRELLAEMGVPNVMCQQAYPFMRPEVREQFHLQMRNPPLLMKYNLTDPGVTYKSFCRFTGYKNRMSASDIVHAATALLELHHGDVQSIIQMTNALMTATTNENSTAVSIAKKISAHDAFHEAYNLLGMKNDSLIKKGITEALSIQRSIVRKASAMLDGQDTIHRHHRLYYAYIKNNFSAHSNGAPGTSKLDSEMELIFGRPMVLAKLGQFIMEVKVSRK